MHPDGGNKTTTTSRSKPDVTLRYLRGRNGTERIELEEIVTSERIGNLLLLDKSEILFESILIFHFVL